ncbi:hypothetical protein NECAME_11140 [Necator americanus]|uniref:Uncharacterized protein n=1 Tax=Necator americanus TaxID=51031 RepID=W2T8J1_NECAM|nr:hypothetical protein NECAME_11140 [Necator americanus]ETN77287.1 hypothetical protein NECAME_11140 [Necator americanus]
MDGECITSFADIDQERGIVDEFRASKQVNIAEIVTVDNTNVVIKVRIGIPRKKEAKEKYVALKTCGAPAKNSD